MTTPWNYTAAIEEIRAKHPLFCDLERAVRVRFPRLDDLKVTLAAIAALEEVDAEDAERMTASNPGVRRIQ
jgi:hypothetical protein